MKRIFLAIALILVLAAAWWVLRTPRSQADAAQQATAADSVWYHQSSARDVAKTGRPQLVEFFHPG
jgi:hypothetical protein